VLADADGSVTVQVEPDLLFINHVSVDATLKSAALVTGAFVVTVPLVATLIEPVPLVMDIPVPAVNVALVRVFPVVLPINS
jgi:hypothetical protein